MGNRDRTAAGTFLDNRWVWKQSHQSLARRLTVALLMALYALRVEPPSSMTITLCRSDLLEGWRNDVVGAGQRGPRLENHDAYD